ncbi:MAG: NAD(P)/FAD-dependent oxidoreductase [Ruminococcaceae bacterium]|nr:NAD(P)/FAD-dependent oxidoreductase [Oscillospiraceae bacterium]
MFDITVIGAGVVGGLIAEALAKYDKKICILEKAHDVAMGATRANSAIVHAGFDAKEGSLKAKMNVRGSELMEGVCRRLGVKFINNEALVVGFENERAEVEALYERGLRNGVRGLSVIERDEMLTIEPNLNPKLSCALLAKTSAIICPYELCLAAVGNAMDNGVVLTLDYEVTSIEKKGEKYVIRSADGRETETRYIINSAGLFSDEIAKMTGDGDFKVNPRRGEYMVLDKECGNFTKRTIFHTPTKMGKGILVSPTVDGNLLVGPTSVDIEDKSDNSTTAEGFAQLFSGAADNVSNIPFNKVITSFCGLRATGNTGDFIIKERDGVITLGGIESPGLTSSPAIAEYIEKMLSDMGALGEKKEGFISERKPAHYFRELSMEEKNEIIKKDPAYGRIVCRCESITEGEIVEALTVNPPARDVDGVKRRTRSGMGRCQGGFCSPTVIALIAREHDIPFESVTKFGKGSVINYRRTKGDE